MRGRRSSYSGDNTICGENGVHAKGFGEDVGDESDVDLADVVGQEVVVAECFKGLVEDVWMVLRSSWCCRGGAVKQ